MATAVVVTVVLVPREMLAPLVGAVIETVGAEVITDTLTEADVTELFESVTRAVREKVPAAVGVHANE